MLKIVKTDTGFGVYGYLDNGPVRGWIPLQSTDQACIYADSSQASDAPEASEMASWKMSPVPKDMIAQILGLIKHYNSIEVMIALYYNAEKDSWWAYPPKQWGVAAHVSYEEDVDHSPPPGYYFSGTVHSHPNMQAFWSATDDADQQGKNGIHMVCGTDAAGNLKTTVRTLYVSGYKADASEAFEMPESPADPPEDWIALIDACREQHAATTMRSAWSTAGDYDIDSLHGTHYWGSHNTYRYSTGTGTSHYRYNGSSLYNPELNQPYYGYNESPVVAEDLEDVLDDSVQTFGHLATPVLLLMYLLQYYGVSTDIAELSEKLKQLAYQNKHLIGIDECLTPDEMSLLIEHAAGIAEILLPKDDSQSFQRALTDVGGGYFAYENEYEQEYEEQEKEEQEKGEDNGHVHSDAVYPD